MSRRSSTFQVGCDPSLVSLLGLILSFSPRVSFSLHSIPRADHVLPSETVPKESRCGERNAALLQQGNQETRPVTDPSLFLLLLRETVIEARRTGPASEAT